MDRKAVSKWKRKHKCETLYEGKDANPNLIVIGEYHGLYNYGKVPELMKAQFELMRALKPKAIAVETAPSRDENKTSLYPLELDFESLEPGLRRFLTGATLVDIYKYVARKFANGELDNDEYRRKLAGFISNWPENLYERQAVDLKSRVHYIDSDAMYDETISLINKFPKKKKIDIKSLLKFEVLCRMRSFVMQHQLKRLQGKGLETIAVMGKAHAEHIIEMPKLDMNRTIIIAQERGKRFLDEEFDSPLAESINEGIFDMLNLAGDLANEERGGSQ